MIKLNKRLLVLTSALTLLPMLAGLLLWERFPEKIATHFNFAGEADGWSGKGFAVFGLPLIVLGIHLICAFGVSLDPKRENVHAKIFDMVLWICPVTSLFACSSVYLYALGRAVNVSFWGSLFAALIFIVVGNYLPKCRRNYTVGIKLPWTLADEDNWNRTHRLGGWLWIGGGVLLLLLQLTGGMRSWTFLAVVLAMVLVPTAYSLALHLKKKEENDSENVDL